MEPSANALPEKWAMMVHISDANLTVFAVIVVSSDCHVAVLALSHVGAGEWNVVRVIYSWIHELSQQEEDVHGD